MAGPMDLRGRVVISDGATATLARIRAELNGIGGAAKRVSTGQFMANAGRSVEQGATRVQKGAVAIQNSATTAALGFAGLLVANKEFNEAKFGYGFARINDYIKDGRFDIAGWKAEMDAVSRTAVDTASAFGTMPRVVMKTREEVEKLGFKGSESEAIFGSALGLHLSEPSALASGEAAKFMGAVYRAYEKQRQDLAKRMGADANEPGFVDAYVKGLAGKAAIAGAESELGPSDIVEGMRQFAPQWAAMGIPYEFALAALAHGANYGFRAPELGTAYKSMVTRTLLPTGPALKEINALGVDRTKFMDSSPADATLAAGRLNKLLNGALFAGKGGGKVKSALIEELDAAKRAGTTSTADFQDQLANSIMKRLGPGWEGRIDDVREAVGNSVMTGTGNIDLPGYLKALRDAGATVGQIATIMEGRHVARNMPAFQFYEKMIALMEKLQATDGGVMDAVVAGRKASEAGSLDALFGAWQSLLLAMQETGVIETAKNALTGLADTLRAMPTWAVTGFTAGMLGLMALGPVVFLVSRLGAALGVLATKMRLLASLAKGGGAAGGAGALGALAASAAAAAAAGRTKAGASLAAGMSAAGAAAANKAIGDRMIAGMGGAAAAGAAGAAAGGGRGLAMWQRLQQSRLAMAGAAMIPGVGQGLMAHQLFGAGSRVIAAFKAGGFRAGMLVPGLGTIMSLAVLGHSLYSGVQKFNETGSLAEALKEGSGLNMWRDMLGGSPAAAATLPPPVDDTGGAGLSPPPAPNLPQQMMTPSGLPSIAAIEAEAQGAAARVKAIFAGLDLYAEGSQAMATFAAGIRDGGAAAISAAGEVAAGVKGAAGGGNTVPLNTGPSMRSAQ